MLRVLWPLLLLAACGENAVPPAPRNEEKAAPQAPSAPPTARNEGKAAAQAPSTPPAPGELGGLPDDGSPVSEAPSAPGGAQAAATVVETYYGLIEAGKYREAWELRWPAKGDDAEGFAANFEKYASYHANVGAPSEPQGAAGSLYVEVPVQLYGRLKSGESFSSAGSITLRRSNNVPGATAEQRKWRIYGGD